MTDRSTHHDTFTIERDIDAPPNLVFFAWANADAKTQWFTAPADKWELIERHIDFREGGKEHAAGRWKTGMVSKFDCIYLDIVPNERIIYSYVMHLDDRKISVSQAAIELTPDNGGTRFTLTEYGDYLDGYDDAGSREHGTNALMDALGKSVGG